MKLATQVTGAGPDIVLVHGWGLPAAIWQDNALALAQHFRVTAIDLPGYGLSPLPDGGYTLDRLAALALSASPARAVWTGWSLGGLVAMQAALTAPGRVAGLVLIGATPRFVQSPDWPHAVSAAILEQFAQDLASGYRLTVKRFLALQARGTVVDRDAVRRLHQQVFGTGDPHPAALQGGLDLLRDTDLRSQLAHIACPVLLLAGEHDTLVPLSASQALVLLLKNARLQITAGAGHAPFLSHPQQFIQAVHDFAARQFPTGLQPGSASHR